MQLAIRLHQRSAAGVVAQEGRCCNEAFILNFLLQQGNEHIMRNRVKGTLEIHARVESGNFLLFRRATVVR